jgi:hypothetical protein
MTFQLRTISFLNKEKTKTEYKTLIQTDVLDETLSGIVTSRFTTFDGLFISKLGAIGVVKFRERKEKPADAKENTTFEDQEMDFLGWVSLTPEEFKHLADALDGTILAFTKGKWLNKMDSKANVESIMSKTISFVGAALYLCAKRCCLDIADYSMFNMAIAFGQPQNLYTLRAAECDTKKLKAVFFDEATKRLNYFNGPFGGKVKNDFITKNSIIPRTEAEAEDADGEVEALPEIESLMRRGWNQERKEKESKAKIEKKKEEVKSKPRTLIVHEPSDEDLPEKSGKASVESDEEIEVGAVTTDDDIELGDSQAVSGQE